MKITLRLFFLLIAFISCDSENNIDQNVTVTLKFTQNWDGVSINSSDFSNFNFTNENGELISIERLRYLVSNISLGDETKPYQLINIGENSGFEINFDNISKGLQNLQFRFGFQNSDNIDGIYLDLNSVSFNVPTMLGGGYHFMQFDGKYKDINNKDANFNYHTIRAVDKKDPDNLIFEDTSFLVDFGNFDIKKNTTIEIQMNVAEWFKNPNTWNLNELNTMLMPNFEAQKLISQNGTSVFSLGEVSH